MRDDVMLPAEVSAESLPSLVDRASRALAEAKTSAEVLDARDMATLAYDASKRAGRLQRAKKAHDDVIAATHRAQADALVIEAAAKRRLADEIDAAQDRGELAKGVDNLKHGPDVPDRNAGKVQTSDLGMTRKQVHEARQIRDAEEAHPGIVKEAVELDLEEGREPTKASLQRSVMAAVSSAQSESRNLSASRRNPNHRPNPGFDRVARLSNWCRQISDLTDFDLHSIRRWREAPSVADRLVAEATAARDRLNEFLGET